MRVDVLTVDIFGVHILKLDVMALIESIMGLRPGQGNLRLVFRLFSHMQGLRSIRLK